MKEKQILFNGDMVRAILSGQKTQARWVVKPQPQTEAGMNCTRVLFFDRTGAVVLDEALEAPLPHVRNVLCPYGQLGDRRWLRETFYAFGSWQNRFNSKKGRNKWHFVDLTRELGYSYHYAADGPPEGYAKHHEGRTDPLPTWWKRPAIFMPRRASRITLDVESVRLERLQEITEEDARAEGVGNGGCLNCGNSEPCGCVDPLPSARDTFVRLWESINGAGSWAANPGVWVGGFRRVEL